MTVPRMPYFCLTSTTALHRHACAPDWSCSLWLSDYDFWIISKGRGYLEIDGRGREVQAPEVYLFTPGQHVLGRHDPKSPLEVWGFHFLPLKKTHRRGLRRWAAACSGLQIRNLMELLALLEIRLKHEGHGDALAKQQSDTLAWLTFALLWRQAHLPPPLPADHRVEALIQQIRIHPEKHWSLETMTGATGLASTQLSKRFGMLTGASPVQFVIQRRIQQAFSLLRETEMPIAQVAESCGYQDVFFFSRQFKKLQGSSPAKYRRHQRNLQR